MSLKFLRKNKKKPREVEEIDITSLLDILVILLVFLLQAFSSSELSINLVDELTLPYSFSRAYGKPGIVVQVDANRQIWINDEKVGKITGGNSAEEDLLKILTNLSYQERKRKSIKKDLPLFINLVFDKQLEYEVVQTVMKTASQAGFGRYKFIIQGYD